MVQILKKILEGEIVHHFEKRCLKSKSLLFNIDAKSS